MLCKILFPLFISITGGVTISDTTRIDTCQAVSDEATAQGVDPRLAVAIAWAESRWFPDVINKRSGARGPMQILPRYWCPSADGVWRIHEYGVRECDFIEGGVRALKYYVDHRKSLRSAVASYGYKGLKHPYVEEVLKLHRAAKTAK